MAPIASFDAGKRQNSHDIQSATSTPSTTTTPSTLVIAVSAVVGAVILIAMMVAIGMIVRKRKQHRRAIAALEGRVFPSPSQHIPVSQIEDMSARPVSGIRRSRIVPVPQSQAGWDALETGSSIAEPSRLASSSLRRRASSLLLPQRTSLLRRLRSFSTIPENSQNTGREASESTLGARDTMNRVMGSPKSEVDEQVTTVNEPVLLQEDVERYLLACPERSKPKVPSSFADDGNSAEGTHGNDQSMPTRSVSMGVLGATGNAMDRYNRAMQTHESSQPQVRKRAVSLGAPPTRPPSGPVPPLPVIPPLNMGGNEWFRRGGHLARMSTTSTVASASSSVLITSPVLKAEENGQTLNTLSLEEAMADSDRTERKSGMHDQASDANRADAQTRSVGSSSKRRTKSRSFLRRSFIRNSDNSLQGRQRSSSSTTSEDSTSHHRLSIPQIATADSVSISRVSSFNSLTGSTRGVQKIITPGGRRATRHHRSQVSASGSPAERKRGSKTVLRDISGNAIKPSPHRKASTSTLNSARSSNGNPFQWDDGADLRPKPSAIRGSPNARKRNRTLSCVRFSTSTPQVVNLNSGSSGDLSALVMDEIREERESDDLKRDSNAEGRKQSGTGTQQEEDTSEQPMHLQKLRLSLGPRSPTLSTWMVFPDEQGSKCQGTRSQQQHHSMPSASSFARSESRQSQNSILIIPSFPSPKNTKAPVPVSGLKTTQPRRSPAGQESPTLGSEDMGNSSPFLYDTPSEQQQPSLLSAPTNSSIEFSPISPMETPPSAAPPASKTAEYDPAWLTGMLPRPNQEYDPASPPITWATRNTSEPATPDWGLSEFWNGSGLELEISEKRRSESLRSNVACNPSSFLGTNVPRLLPPILEHHDVFLPPSQPRAEHTQQRPYTITPLRPRRPGPLPTPALSTIPQSSDDSSASTPTRRPRVPSLARETKQTRHAPQGPRIAPAKSVLKNAAALRRMNSEIQMPDNNRESRNWARLGREPSLLLPWAGDASPNDPASRSDVSDYEIRTGAEADQERGEEQWRGIDNRGTYAAMGRSALDDLDLQAIERSIDGAIAGFDAGYKAWSTPRHPPVPQVILDEQGQYWAGQPGSLEMSQFRQASRGVTPPREQRPGAGMQLTPGSSAKGGMANRTPPSLYDANGFLKTFT